MSRLIDGKKLARETQEWLAKEIIEQTKNRRRPFLAVLLVGENPASKIYVSHKEKACHEAHIDSETIHLPEKTSEAEVLKAIHAFNQDPNVDGILVQMPLPSHINSFNIISAISPAKDVDGLTPHNQGLLAMNQPCHVPCTPKGVMALLKSIRCETKGKIAAVIGRSVLVGSPMAKLLLHSNATVVHIHSHTKNPWELTNQADILVAAAGIPKLVDEHWIKEGAVVIDVGIHRLEGKGLCGDVDFEKVKDKVSWISPVPGGVGPMTIASLLGNCYEAWQNSSGSK